MFNRKRLLILLVLVAVFAAYRFATSRAVHVGWPSDGVVTAVFSPVARGGKAVSTRIQSFFSHYFWLTSVAEQNEVLKAEIERLKLNNQFLKRKLDFAQADAAVRKDLAPISNKLLPAGILAFDPFGAARTVLIDKGSSDGARVDMPVVVGEGLVGRVWRVYNNTSRVLLLIDPHFAIDAVSVRSQARVLVSGLSDQAVRAERNTFLTQLEYLTGSQDIKTNDVLVSSGMSQLYPKGLPIGTVLKAHYSETGLFHDSLVRPAVDFAKLTQVYLMLPAGVP